MQMAVGGCRPGSVMNRDCAHRSKSGRSLLVSWRTQPLAFSPESKSTATRPICVGRDGETAEQHECFDDGVCPGENKTLACNAYYTTAEIDRYKLFELPNVHNANSLNKRARSRKVPLESSCSLAISTNVCFSNSSHMPGWFLRRLATSSLVW